MRCVVPLIFKLGCIKTFHSLTEVRDLELTEETYQGEINFEGV